MNTPAFANFSVTASAGNPVSEEHKADDESVGQKRNSKEGEGAAAKGRPDQSFKVAKSSKHAKDMVSHWVSRALDMGVPALVDEFRGSLSKWAPEGMTTNAFQANRDKNRYLDVPCQDQRRVILNWPGLPNDYIHANYVANPARDHRFICAQGPLDNTQLAFWAMVVQEKCECIIMLCNTIECVSFFQIHRLVAQTNLSSLLFWHLLFDYEKKVPVEQYLVQGKFKCSQYWPREKGETMTFGEGEGKIVVTNLETRPMSEEDNFIRVCKLKLDYAEKGKPVSTVITHFQWENWPDRGKPILVHCSAGIGRTGTIVAIAYVQEKMQHGQNCMDMDALTKELRTQRPYSIQNEFKYRDRFAHVLAGDGEAKYAKWLEDYKTLTGCD
ncbi:unnamed protein product [Nippostrongylus brasiliensis]|uniref:Protein-tyrosine phosphatase n=1 Tax=Nippostrongylus brasiliensis TaxID=27835 RepID=A0A0N4Y5Z0_NIPBR|nr:unnamed protein product [Nippostrongylus brasiliensis]